MEEKRSELKLPKLNRKSLLFQTFAIVLSFTLVICLSFYYVNFKQLQSLAARNLSNSLQEITDTAASSTDATLSASMLLMDQLSMNSDIADLVSKGELTGLESYHAGSVLNGLVRNTTTISSAFIYYRNSGMIINSDLRSFRFGSDTNTESNYITSFEYANNNQSDIIRVTLYGKPYFLFADGGQLILVRNFPLSTDSNYASMYFILNMKSLSTLIGTDPGILVTNSENYYLFQTDTLSFDQERIPEFLSTQEVDNNGTVTTFDNFRVFRSESTVSGMHFFYCVPETALVPASSTFASLLIRSIFVLILFSLLIAFILSYILYRPYKKLLNILGGYGMLRPRTENEIDFLNNSLLHFVTQKDELQSLMSRVSDDVNIKLFTDILSGKTIEPETLSAYLDETGSRFHYDRRYTLYRIPNFTHLSVVQQKDYRSQLQKILPTIAPAKDLIYQDLEFHNDLFIVFSFSKNLTTFYIRELIEQINQKLSITNKSKLSPGRMSRVYRSMSDVYLAFLELTRAPEEDFYIQQPASVQTTTEEKEEVEQLPLSYFQLRAEQLGNLTQKRESHSAKKLYQKTLEEILSSSEETELIITHYNIFINFTMDAIYKASGFPPSSFHHRLTELTEEAYQDIPVEERLTSLMQIANAFLDETEERLAKENHHYIVDAKRFIEEHYSDPNLDLSLVSTALHTNPSYLSKLFVTNLDMKFTDYLNDCRTRHACELLETTSYSVASIAEQCGFASPQVFIRVFKKHMSITPGQYRKQKAHPQ